MWQLLSLLLGLVVAARASPSARDRPRPNPDQLLQQTQPKHVLHRLHERHQASWQDMPAFEIGHELVTGPGHVAAPSLGLVTAVRHHPLTGARSPAQTHPYLEEGSKRVPRSLTTEVSVHLLEFQLAELPLTETTLSAQLRVHVAGNEARLGQQACTKGQADASTPRKSDIWVELLSNDERDRFPLPAVFEPDENRAHECRGWLTLPFCDRLLGLLGDQRKRGGADRLAVKFRLLNHTISADAWGQRPVNESAHLITYHRDEGMASRLRAQQALEPTAYQHPVLIKRPRELLRQRRRRRRSAAGWTRQRKWSSRQRNTNTVHFHKWRLRRVCQRRDLVVNFASVGWDKIVLHPMSYNAGYCWGHCPFPLSSHYNTTNHAIVMYMMHSTQRPRGVNVPCCVAHGMAPQTLMYKDTHGSLVSQIYEDMKVTSCACR